MIINGKKLAEIRTKKTRWTTRNLAQRIGMRPAELERIESQERVRVTPRFVQGLCLLFRMADEAIVVQPFDAPAKPPKEDPPPKPQAELDLKTNPDPPLADTETPESIAIEGSLTPSLETICEAFTEDELVEMLKDAEVQGVSKRWKEETLAAKVLELGLYEGRL